MAMQRAAAVADTAANIRNAPLALPLASLNQPMSEGPTNPPTLKAVFTRAIPAAAAVPRSNAGARHKKGGT
jgi:hypothetical protein